MIRDLLRLARPRVCALAGAGTLAGYVLARPAPDARLAGVLAGALLLAAGCSALNQVQERREDSRMERTRQRPLPAGRLTAGQGLLTALILLAAAAACLDLAGGDPCLLLAGFVLCTYNGLYTPLKKVTAFAMLAGGLAGAMPPVLGWAGAGGDPLDPRILALAGVFYCWQVPHFWLFAQLHRQDYARAGFRVPRLGPGEALAARPLWLWLGAYCAGLLFLPVAGLGGSPAGRWFPVLLGLAVAGSAPLFLSRQRLGFALVNVSLLLLLCGLTAEALWLGA